jgi:DNA-binding transcriptional regulator YiaG
MQNYVMNAPSPDEIRKAREEVGLTQTEAAERIWMSLRAWQDWEGGKRAMLPIAFWAFQQKIKHLR